MLIRYFKHRDKDKYYYGIILESGVSGSPYDHNKNNHLLVADRN